MVSPSRASTECQFIQAIAPNIPVEAINQTIAQLIGDNNIVIA